MSRVTQNGSYVRLLVCRCARSGSWIPWLSRLADTRAAFARSGLVSHQCLDLVACGNPSAEPAKEFFLTKTERATKHLLDRVVGLVGHLANASEVPSADRQLWRGRAVASVRG